MQLAKWLLSVADYHEKRKESHACEGDESAGGNSGSSNHKPVSMEERLRGAIIETCGGIPVAFKELTFPAIICLSRLLKQKMAGEDKILGHELIGKLELDTSSAFEYLQSLDELEQSGFVELIEDSGSLTRMRPFCWLQSRIEVGDALAAMDTGVETCKDGFDSNEAYLDTVVQYLDRWINRTRAGIPSSADSGGDDLLRWEADAAYIEIQQQVDRSSVPLPSAEIKNTFHLSEWQHLYLIGLLGQREKTIEYDFRDMNDVVRLFVSGITARSLLREHLAGKKSPLVKHRLIESSENSWGENVDLTMKAVDSMLQRPNRGRSFMEIRETILQRTLFGIEKPKVHRDALLLAPQVKESLSAMLNAERPEGKKARNELQKQMPAAIGSPKGTTVLLYGPPGTGKTLTAQYIASELKTILLTVDCSSVIDKYVGESEKNVRKLFDDYRDVCKFVRGTPILLLNEADQFLTSRISTDNSIDRMHNNTLNLFLEGLERFDGILVATTNLKELLDDAFSRRFTYKLELQTPDKELRRRIWETHLPKQITGNDVDFDKLASFHLTGGEIRLVIDQAVRAASYSGSHVIGGGLLMKLAKEEEQASGKMKLGGTIGFKTCASA